MMTGNAQPLVSNQPIVRPDGTPTDYFVRWAQARQIDITAGIDAAAAQALAEEAARLAIIAFAASRKVIAGTGLGGGGTLDADVTLNLADTSVDPGEYGDATHAVKVTVDQQGRITEIVEVPITGGGGGGGAIPPTFIQSSTVVGNANPTAVLPAAPTDGNLLIAFGTHWNNSLGVMNGYTMLYSTNGGANAGLMVAYKVAAGDAAAQTPFSTGGSAQTLTVFEVSDFVGPPTMVNSFQESGANPAALSGFSTPTNLIVGQFTQAQSSDPFALSGDVTVAQDNVTGDPGTNGPYRVQSFHYVPAGAPVSVTATLGAAHNLYGIMINIPGSPGESTGGTKIKSTLLRLDGDLSTPGNTWLKPAAWVELRDELNTHDPAINPERITVPAGVTRARATGKIIWSNSSGSKYAQIHIVSGGVDTTACGSLVSAVNESFQSVISPWFDVISGDYFYMEINSGSSGGSLSGTATNFGGFTMMQVEFELV